METFSSRSGPLVSSTYDTTNGGPLPEKGLNIRGHVALHEYMCQAVATGILACGQGLRTIQ